jgi:hypothetical protein
MSKFDAGRLLLLVLCIQMGGCLTSFSSARSEFRAGEYGTARERLLALEGAADKWEPRDHARYALYRGLVHHALSEAVPARTWLERARVEGERDPEAFDADERARLHVASESLGLGPEVPR